MPTVRVEFRDRGNALTPSRSLALGGPTIPIAVTRSVGRGRSTSAETELIVYALIDTGASMSCIDNALAMRLGLRVIDRTLVGGVKGRHEHDVYLGRLGSGDLGIVINGRLIAVDLDPDQPVIIGRDFLAHTIMIYDGLNGSITLSC